MPQATKIPSTLHLAPHDVNSTYYINTAATLLFFTFTVLAYSTSTERTCAVNMDPTEKEEADRVGTCSVSIFIGMDN